MLLGEKIKEEIEKSGIPIRQVALKIEMSEQNLHRIFKKDTIETKKLEQISSVLGVPIDAFFQREGRVNRIQQHGNFNQAGNNNQQKNLASDENLAVELEKCQLEVTYLKRENDLLRGMLEKKI